MIGIDEKEPIGGRRPASPNGGSGIGVQKWWEGNRGGVHRAAAQCARRDGDHRCRVSEAETGTIVEKISDERLAANLIVDEDRTVYVGRTFLEGQSENAYDAANPANAGNSNFGNKVGLAAQLGDQRLIAFVSSAKVSQLYPVCLNEETIALGLRAAEDLRRFGMLWHLSQNLAFVAFAMMQAARFRELEPVEEEGTPLARRLGHGDRLAVVRLLVGGGQGLDEAGVDAKRGVDQRGVDPQQRLRVDGRVGRAVRQPAADARVDRTTFACSIPFRPKSSAYRVVPKILSTASWRGRRLPTIAKSGVLAAVMRATPLRCGAPPGRW